MPTVIVDLNLRENLPEVRDEVVRLIFVARTRKRQLPLQKPLPGISFAEKRGAAPGLDGLSVVYGPFFVELTPVFHRRPDVRYSITSLPGNESPAVRPGFRHRALKYSGDKGEYSSAREFHRSVR
jgi:hypothetical protein